MNVRQSFLFLGTYMIFSGDNSYSTRLPVRFCAALRASIFSLGEVEASTSDDGGACRK